MLASYQSCLHQQVSLAPWKLVRFLSWNFWPESMPQHTNRASVCLQLADVIIEAKNRLKQIALDAAAAPAYERANYVESALMVFQHYVNIRVLPCDAFTSLLSVLIGNGLWEMAVRIYGAVSTQVTALATEQDTTCMLLHYDAVE